MRIPFERTANPRNYLQKLLAYPRLLEAENSLSQVDEFARACLDCFRIQAPYGIYNLTNPGSVWTSEVTQLIRECGVANREFEFFASEAEFMQRAARTPRSNCVLDVSKALRAGLKLTPVRDALLSCLQNWTSETTVC